MAAESPNVVHKGASSDVEALFASFKETGDDEFLSEIYRQTEAEIQSVLARRLQDKEAARDIPHNVWEEFLSRAKTDPSTISNARNFLVAWTRLLIKRHFREIKAGKIQSEDGGAAKLVPIDASTDDAIVMSCDLLDCMTPHDVMCSREDAEAVNRELKQLSPRLKEVIDLRFWDGLPHKEVAQLLGISEGTAKEYAGQALVKLRQKLKR